MSLPLTIDAVTKLTHLVCVSDKLVIDNTSHVPEDSAVSRE